MFNIICAYHCMHVYNLGMVIVDYDPQASNGDWFPCAFNSKEHEVCYVASIL